jgi:hypothetical protein
MGYRKHFYNCISSTRKEDPRECNALFQVSVSIWMCIWPDTLMFDQTMFRMPVGQYVCRRGGCCYRWWCSLPRWTLTSADTSLWPRSGPWMTSVAYGRPTERCVTCARTRARAICRQAVVERPQGLRCPPRLIDPHKKPGGMFPLQDGHPVRGKL